MARPWRIQFDDAVYHITTRGNFAQEVFLSDDDRRHFLGLLGRASSRFNLEIFAFCLMSNHFHLFLRTAEANLAQAMQWLIGSYTLHFNRRRGRYGHLFHGRYKSVLVVDEVHWLHLSVYLHLNPVRAQMVEDPAEYEWSSCRDYLAAKPRFSWLRSEEILSNYGPRQSRRREYRRALLAMIGKEPAFVKQLKSGIILGTREKLAELVKKHKPAGRTGDVPQYQSARRREFDPAWELKRVAKVFGVTPEILREKRKNFPAKLAAYYHLVDNLGMSSVEAGRIMGVSHSAVSVGIRNFRRLLGKDEGLRATVKRLARGDNLQLKL